MADPEQNEAAAGLLNFVQSSDPPVLYTNLMRITNTAGEFILEFGAGTRENAVSVCRLGISPLRIKGMLRTIEDNVKRYEGSFGLLLPQSIEELIDDGIPKIKPDQSDPM